MDPLSIATAAVGTTKVLYRASSTIYDFIQDAKIVDKQLENLRSEFDSTARVLEVVRVRLRNPIHLIHARSQEHQAFLDIALASIQECDNASLEVIAKIEAIGEGPAWLKSRAMRQLQYKRAQKDVLKANTRIRDQKQNLQLLIQMLDVLLTHQSAALLTEKVLPPLSSLQLLIEKASTSGAEVYVHPTEDGNQLTLATRTQSARETASTTPPTEPAIPIADNGTNEGEETPADQEDIRTIQAFQIKAADLLEDKKYASAEKAFLSCLKMYEVLPIDSVPMNFMVQAQLGLAVVYMYQEKWSQAKDIFRFLASSDDDIQAQSLYYLAQVYLAEHEFDSAYTACLEARSKFCSAGERSDCNALMVLIAQTNEDETAATIYAAGLTDEPDWSISPFYRFTAKGHGLPIESEKAALAYIESQTDSSPNATLTKAALSGNTAVVKLILWQGTSLDNEFFLIPQHPPLTALMAAARGGYLSIVKILLYAGADVELGCHGHKARLRTYCPIKISTLHYAVASKSGPVTQIILDFLAPNAEEYLDAVVTAMDNQATEPLKVLLRHPDIRTLIKSQEGQGQDFLQKAVSGSNLLVIRALLASELFTVDMQIINEANRVVSEETTGDSVAVFKELVHAVKV